MVTMKDIADLTGVSISTVSRVLNNKGKISTETKKKVLGAAAELMFKKGMVSQSVGTLSHRIGIVVPGRGEYYHDDPASSSDIRSIRSGLENEGHSAATIPYNPVEDPTGEMVMMELRDRKVDGVILSDPPVDSPVAALIRESSLPMIQVNGIPAAAAENHIDYNNYSGMKEITEKVLQKGHTDLVVLTGPEKRSVSTNRMEGYLAALEEHPADITHAIIPGDFSLDSGYRRMKDHLELTRDFTAVIAFSDYIAMGAMRALRESGLSIPSDVAVTGFDDIEMARYTEPPLTTVHRYSDRYAPFVISTLSNLIEKGSDVETLSILFRTEIVERESL